MTCIIVDDEISSRDTLQKIVENYCNDLIILDKANSVETAHKSILTHKPDLVFLDIEMPDGNAFDLLEKFETIHFKIIFTTAYEQYALNAIKIDDADYLLKPLSIKEVIDAVEKFKKKTTSLVSKDELFQLLSTFKIPKNYNPYIPIPTNNGYEMIDTKDIIRCEANESYTHIFLLNNVKKTISKKIGEIESTLSPQFFFRIHHSFIINKAFLKNYIRGEGGYVKMADNTEVPVSKRKKSEFLGWLTEG
ncbi:MAG: response regulator transcription factor [Chitinophagaceae bacterium]|nr:response regulator transcription factor [Chitinophagaceae bacterium]